MNFLQLCQRAAQEAGVSRSTAGPVSVLSQTGELGKIVSWVSTAYEDIQNANQQWEFLREDFSFPTIATVSTYLPSAVSLSEHAMWKEDSIRAYLTSTGQSDEQMLDPLAWDEMRDVRLYGTIVSGRPWEVAFRPNKAMVLWPTPDAVYTITGEYWRRAQTMTANADEPLIPVPFRMAIVWGAVRYYAGDQGAAELFALADQHYKRIMRALTADQLPDLAMAGPLA